MEHKESVILIVDDNPHNIKVLGATLEGEEYQVAVAMNGPEGIEFAIREKPDLILLDVMMPDMNGFEVCRQLKESFEAKHIPVIFITARSEVEDIVRGFKVGAVDYIKKPFNSAELLARVHTHIELKKAREEIQTLRGIIPICARCKKIRNDTGFWEQVEFYIQKHSEARFSHGLCPHCMDELYGDQDWYKERDFDENE